MITISIYDINVSRICSTAARAYLTEQGESPLHIERSFSMFEKLKSLFKSSDKPKKKPAQHTNKAKTSGNNAKPKVQPTRIGELGEHKINIQLDQLPKG